MKNDRRTKGGATLMEKQHVKPLTAPILQRLGTLRQRYWGFQRSPLGCLIAQNKRNKHVRR